MKYYIASTLGNFASVRNVRDRMQKHGHTITYDWTKHLGAAHLGPDGLGDIAIKEFYGVTIADVVIVLLPGGKGTHTELGMAIAMGKPIVIWDETRSVFTCDDTTCSFYWLPGIARRFAGKLTDRTLDRLAIEAEAALTEYRLKRGAYVAQ